jgi:hypothetical protein
MGFFERKKAEKISSYRFGKTKSDVFIRKVLFFMMQDVLGIFKKYTRRLSRRASTFKEAFCYHITLP